MSNTTKNMEEFKKNFTLLEKRVQTITGNDLVNDANYIVSWFRYAMQPEVTKEQMTVIVKEFIPNIVRNIFMRKTDNLSIQDALALLPCLETAIITLSSHFGSDENLNKTLCMIVDRNQPLYQKIQADISFKGEAINPANNPTIVTNPPDTAFFDSLEIGTYVDYYVVEKKKWEMAAVEQFSENRKDMEIVIGEHQYMRKWATIETDHTLFAACGTKSLIENAEPPVIIGHVDAASSVHHFDDNTIEVGMLIDAKDSYGTWFQACIMEIKEDLVPVIVITPATTEATTDEPNESDISTSPAIATDEKQQENQETFETMTSFRIAFLGLSDYHDEWIPYPSPRIAKYNAFSKGKRGDLAIREEIAYLCWKGTISSSHLAEKFAVLYEYAFPLKPIVKYINAFGHSKGFERLFQILDIVVEDRNKVALEKILPLVVFMGHISKFLNKTFLDEVSENLISNAGRLLMDMSDHDIRTTSMESIETVIAAIEQLTYVVYGRNEVGGNMFERFKLQFAMRYLSCNMLNRRLFGLKMINDLIKQSNQKALYPTGIQRVEQKNSQGKELIHYNVVSITYGLSNHDLCLELQELQLFNTFYLSNDMHESLLLRSTPILSLLASEDILDSNQVEVLLQVGLQEHTAILQVFVEAIASFSPSKMFFILDLLKSIDEKAVRDVVVDIVYQMAISCRKKIMTSSSTEGVGAKSDKAKHALCRAHNQALALLWFWSMDQSEISDEVVALSTEKLEHLLELGIPLQDAMQDTSFPWSMQWYRVQDIVTKSIEALNGYQSIVPALKMLQKFIFAWPTSQPAAVEDATRKEVKTPFIPLRYAATEYLIQQFDFYGILTKVVLHLKKAFNKISHDGGEDHASKVKLGHSRVSYLTQLELILDTLYLTYRSVDKKHVPEEALYSIWKTLVLNAKVLDEFDSVMMLLLKVPTKIAIDGKVSVTSTSFFHESSQTYIALFKDLLCNTPHVTLLQSPYFSIKTLKCIEKWFRWINSELGLLQEGKDGKILSLSKDAKDLIGIDVFVEIVLHCTSDSVAANAVTFITSLLHASPRDDNSLSSSAKSTSSYRQHVLQCCLQHLDQLSTSSNKSSTDNSEEDYSSRLLQRVLLLLDGLIDESYRTLNSAHPPSSSSTKNVYPHAAVGQGALVTFKISSTSQKMKNLTGEIKLRLHESIETLIQTVASFTQLAPTDIKIFRLGKEMTGHDERKAIATLPRISERESLVVVEKPHLKSVTIATNSTESSDEAKNGDGQTAASAHSPESQIENWESESLPSVLNIAVDYERFQTFFRLIQQSKSDLEVDALWKTLTQLPTSQFSLIQWVLLECEDVEQMIFPLNADNMYRICELYYVLQVVECLLHPIISIADLLAQYGGNDGVLDGILEGQEHWCHKFILKNGVPFLSKAYQWISAIMYQYANQTGDHHGMSKTLLMSVSRLCCKLLRSFSIHLLFAKYSSKSVQQSSHGKSTDGLVSLFNSFYSKYEADNILSNVHKIKAGDNTQQVFETREAIMKYEWGRQISLNRLTSDGLSYIVDYYAVDTMFWSCTLSMLALCQLYHNAAKQESASSSNMSKSDDRMKSLLFPHLQDILFIWMSVAMLKPSLLNKMTYSSKFHLSASIQVDYQQLIQAGDLWHEIEKTKVSSDHQSDSTVTKEAESIIIVHPFRDWLPNALSYFVTTMSSFSSLTEQGKGGSVSNSGNKANNLKMHLLNVLLQQRPSIHLAQSLKDAVSHSRQSVFSLLSTILAMDNESMTAQILPLCTSTCETILEEMKLTVDRYTIASQKSDTSKQRLFPSHLFENLKLLTLLTEKLDEEHIAGVFERKVVDFLLQEVLGLVPPSFLDAHNGTAGSSGKIILLESLQLHALQEDTSTTTSVSMLTNVSKSTHKKKSAEDYVYAVLQAVTNSSHASSAIVARVFQQLRELHRSLHMPSTWDMHADRESRGSNNNFVGLKNLGSTCYMNSFLQMLFMQPEVRQYMLYYLSLDALYASDTESTEQQGKEDLVFQLQRLFLQLHCSGKKAITPNDWVYAFKDETGTRPINVSQQQDATEFFLLLCDRYEYTIQTHRRIIQQNKAANAARLAQEGATEGSSVREEQAFYLPEDILRLTFGGKICNLMHVVPDEKHVIEDEKTITDCIKKYGLREPGEESFMCISLNVKGCDTLEESLAQFISGERISEYSWQANGPKKNIMKRQLISELNNSLVFHLKRFELNFDTFERVKVNDALQFPMTLNMRPYTKSGQDAEFSGFYQGLKTNSMPTSDDYYVYELTGVIVHMGTSHSGHYFSYLKDSQSGMWYEFNDSDIHVFDVNQLAKECFGGSHAIHDYNTVTQSFVTTEVVSSKNAYIVVYSRVKKSPYPSSVMPSMPTAAASSNTPIGKTAQPKTSFALVARSSIAHKAIQQLEEENTQQLLLTRVLHKAHIDYYTALLPYLLNPYLQVSMPNQGSTSKRVNVALQVQSILLDIYRFLMKYVLKTTCYDNFHKLSQCLVDLVAKYDRDLADVLYQYLQAGSRASIRLVSNLGEGGTISNVGSSDSQDKENQVPTATPNNVVAGSASKKKAPPSVAKLNLSVVLSKSTDADDNVDVMSARSSNSQRGDSGRGTTPRSSTPRGATPTENMILSTPAVSVRTPRHPATENSPSVSPSTAYISKSILHECCIDFHTTVMQNLLAPKDVLRDYVAYFFARILAQCWDLETPKFHELSFAQLKKGSLSLVSASGGGTNGTGGNLINLVDGDDADPELEYAIQMSQQSGIPVTATPNKYAATQALSISGEMSLSFIIELTNDSNMQLIAEHWRKSNGMIKLLANIAREGIQQRALLIQRDLIASIVDIFLGDQSPLCGKLYNAHSRKRAPTSYINIPFVKDTNTLSYQAKNTPNWTDLLEVLQILVADCTFDRQENAAALPNHIPGDDHISMYMSMWDMSCMTSKTFYHCALRQARYMTSISQIVSFMSMENRQFTSMMLELIWEEMSIASYDHMAHLFQLMHSFVCIQDSYTANRIMVLFATRGQQSLLEMMQGYKTQPAKTLILIVFIRSWISLILQSPPLFEMLGKQVNQIKEWAAWMLHFLSQQIVAYSKLSANSIGPYLVVFGEEEAEREISWYMRLDRSFQTLTALLPNWGIQPHVLLQQYTANLASQAQQTQPASSGSGGVQVAVATQSQGQAHGPNNYNSMHSAAIHPMPMNASSPQPTNNSKKVVELHDGMTDEELARMLQYGDSHLG